MREIIPFLLKIDQASGFIERGGAVDRRQGVFGFISCKVEIVLLIFTSSKMGFRLAVCARLSSNFHDLFFFLFLSLHISLVSEFVGVLC